MKYNPDIHHRRSVRLKEYDYSQPGAYFITVCTQKGECVFGDVVGGEIVFEQFCRPVSNSILINDIHQTPGIPLWQRNYYEHIIRNEDGFNKIREYIQNNPQILGKTLKDYD